MGGGVDDKKSSFSPAGVAERMGGAHSIGNRSDSSTPSSSECSSRTLRHFPSGRPGDDFGQPLTVSATTLGRLWLVPLSMGASKEGMTLTIDHEPHEQAICLDSCMDET